MEARAEEIVLVYVHSLGFVKLLRLDLNLFLKYLDFLELLNSLLFLHKLLLVLSVPRLIVMLL